VAFSAVRFDIKPQIVVLQNMGAADALKTAHSI